MLCTNQSPGMIQEGGISPLLGRFKGDCKGARAPVRIQRSDSRGKRRNNETDETCRLRRGEGCVVCSDVNPPLPFFLSTVNGAFFLMLRKKAGLKSPRLRRGIALSGYKRSVTPFGVTKPRPSGAIGPRARSARIRCHPSGDEMKIGCICSPRSASSTVSGRRVKSATTERGFLCGASCRMGTK